MKLLSIPLSLSAIVLTLAFSAQAQTCSLGTISTLNHLGRSHFAFSAECPESIFNACTQKSAEVKRNCEFRNEDGGTRHTSCNCQANRAGYDCLVASGNLGCRELALLIFSTTPECFLPPPRPEDEEECAVRNYEGECSSPILIDVAGDGHKLTSLAAGVTFDLRGTGRPLFTAWTEPSSDDAWLALDRNQNGRIDNGIELFGDYTPQPEGRNKNGFLALAEFDRVANGGNNDGLISSADRVFGQLRLWQDRNHNGISESEELLTLLAVDLLWLELDYKRSRRVDEHGNGFRYRAKVKDARGGSVGRWAWDVYLVNRFIQ